MKKTEEILLKECELTFHKLCDAHAVLPHEIRNKRSGRSAENKEKHKKVHEKRINIIKKLSELGYTQLVIAQIVKRTNVYISNLLKDNVDIK